MTNQMQAQVEEFHGVFGHPIAAAGPTLVSKELGDLRHELIREELQEYRDALDAGDLTEIADALGDILYVTFGAAIVHGIDLEGIVNIIHASNLSKMGADGMPIYREDGKVEKGPNYFPPTPYIEREIQRQRWNVAGVGEDARVETPERS